MLYLTDKSGGSSAGFLFVHHNTTLHQKGINDWVLDMKGLVVEVLVFYLYITAQPLTRRESMMVYSTEKSGGSRAGFLFVHHSTTLCQKGISIDVP